MGSGSVGVEGGVEVVEEDEAVGKGAGCRGGGGGREASSLRVSFADKRWLNVFIL